MAKKYNRSKTVKTLITEGKSVEEIIQHCMTLGEDNEANLRGFVKRTAKALTQVKASK